MNISSVASPPTYSGSAGISRLQAESSGQVKTAQVQQEIQASVINQIQDQQQQAAESLINMMKNQVDIFA